ncbi:MAG TPA: adenylate/guanylate cyclase domain-containing protein [Minicystis sp.]|nr:adenylate/guanylate cyclase domain-containing protein [Minicystis sp.]
MARSRRASAAPARTMYREGQTEADERDPFEKALTREILISERLRVTLLFLIPGVGMILFLALSAVYPDLSHRLFRVEMDRLRVGAFLGVVAVYEFFSLFQVERLIRGSLKPPVLRRYVNAAIEVSLPTFVVLYYMTVVSPVDALLLPPATVYFIFILLSTLRLDFGLSFFTGAVAAFEYGVVAIAVVGGDPDKFPDPVLATAQHHLGKALVLLVSGIAAGFVARRLRKGFENTFRSLEERSRILNVFGQHVSPAVVDRLLAARAESKSEVREVCVMFLDIRNFTRFSENRTPEEVVGYLNSVFEFMVAIVNERQGIVNKFLGDGFMAVFGAPLQDDAPCAHAVDAALAIVAELDARVARGAIPETRVGIGLHAGPAVIGNVGSGTRKEYTVIGDVVNVASRIEALNKDLGTRVLATDAVWDAAGRDDVEAKPHEPLVIRGRERPVRVVELA